MGIPFLPALAERTELHLKGKGRAKIFEILPAKRGELSEGGTELAACGRLLRVGEKGRVKGIADEEVLSDCLALLYLDQDVSHKSKLVFGRQGQTGIGTSKTFLLVFGVVD